jgi:hypothetical protein
VRADVQGRDMTVAISDNGRGFDPATASDRGLGLQGMEERARLLGGMLRITSEPQGGTTIEVIVPLLVPEWLPTIDTDSVTADPWLADDDVQEPLDGGVRNDEALDTASAQLLVSTPESPASRPVP